MFPNRVGGAEHHMPRRARRADARFGDERYCTYMHRSPLYAKEQLALHVPFHPPAGRSRNSYPRAWDQPHPEHGTETHTRQLTNTHVVRLTQRERAEAPFLTLAEPGRKAEHQCTFQGGGVH